MAKPAPYYALACILLLFLAGMTSGSEPQAKAAWSPRVQTVLDATRPLQSPRQTQLPLYLWPASNPGKLDDATAERLVQELERRGVGLVSSWSPGKQESTLAQGLTVARAQHKLGVPVNVNATACLNSFFNGDPQTAHLDAAGQPFWDESFDSGSSKHHIGCPFAIDFRTEAIREQVEPFVRAYEEAGMGIDFIFADWEIDGPLDYNGAHAAAQRCTRCRAQLQDPANFLEFQKKVRDLRSALQRAVFTEPVLERFPAALVGNYAVYPNDGYRYWYDYFETFVEGQPHIADQGARYRLWAQEFAGTGYTCAMPVVYTWYPTWLWYDFKSSDYHWFYNMLLVASNAGKSTPAATPIVSFVHWHTTAPPPQADPQVKPMSAEAYQELLWHMLLRGTDTFFLWCPTDEDAEECRLVHEVFADAQRYADFLKGGVPVLFDVAKQPGVVVSAVAWKGRLLVRRTDFVEGAGEVEIAVGARKVKVGPSPGKCQVLELPERQTLSGAARRPIGVPK
ncbi:MAG: hypothetical protein ACYC6Y_11575 [Thermoguttaceae bacterium]